MEQSIRNMNPNFRQPTMFTGKEISIPVNRSVGENLGSYFLSFLSLNFSSKAYIFPLIQYNIMYDVLKYIIIQVHVMIMMF